MTDAQHGTQRKPQGNFFLRHWRGELPLATSFWISLILPSAIIGLAWLYVAAFYGVLTGITLPPIDFSSPALRLAVVAGLGVLGIVTVWQIVGVKHSIFNMPEHESSGWSRAADGYLSFAGFERFFLALAFLIIVFGTVDTSEIWITEDGEGIVFDGEITPKSAYEFKRVLDNTPSVRVVHLNSPGGIVSEARSMASEIRQRKLDTSVPVACHSACTYVFMFGKNRHLEEGAELGFHAPALVYPPADAERRAREEEMMMIHHRGMIAMLPVHLPKSFIDKWMDTPSTSFWIPDRNELVAAGIIEGTGAAQKVDTTTAGSGQQ